MRRPLHTLIAAAALALGLVLAPATALAAQAETDGILVTLSQPGTGEISLLSDARSALDDAGLEPGDVVSAQTGELTIEARPADGQTDEQALATALELPGVTDAQLNYVYHIIEPVTEGSPSAADGISPQAQTLLGAILANDPYAQVSDPDESPNQYWLYSSGLVDAWSLGQPNKRVTIAMFDSGVTLDHPDLAGNLLSGLAWDSYYDRSLAETKAMTGTTDNGGHGTMVAGVLAAVTNNGTGVAGSSYNASLLPVKVVNDSNGNTNTGALARAYAYLFKLINSGQVSNVRVVNMSLGGYGDAFSNDATLRETIHEARYSYGILTVCAGGNGKNGQPMTEPCYPADYDDCVSVTALEADGTNISWSDYNAEKDISAPGRSIWTTSASGAYGSNSGTSLAAPMVSGTVALMSFAEPTATTDEIVAALEDSATPVVDRENDRTHTSGSAGALDADAAVQLIKDRVTRFNDVHEGDWFYNTVLYVAKNEIMNGYGDGRGFFGVNDRLTREDTACILYNYLGNGEVVEPCALTDVNQDAYYAAAVNWCVDQGVFNGKPNGTFGVGESITREQLMSVIYNWAAQEGDVVDESVFYGFADCGATSTWAIEGVQWAVDRGVINGSLNADGTRSLNPLGNTSRAEAASIITNAIDSGVL